MWKLVFTKLAQKDALNIKAYGLKPKVEELLEIISTNPYMNPPTYEKLKGDLEGLISRRINIQHRLVYQVIELEHTIKVIRMWTHYE